MRPISDWDYSDLQELLRDQVQESLTLDYKASAALAKTDAFRTEISKDVSAFANSAGGRIIYGIVEAGSVPTAIDEGADPKVFTREWLEQIIGSNIQPRVQGLQIRQIELPGEKVSYVVDIPQATYLAPHQARDRRYYRRFNFQSVPMEDYEVRDILRRASSPDIYLEFQSGRVTEVDDNIVCDLKVIIGNKSSEPAQYVVINIYVDLEIYVSGIAGFESLEAEATLKGAPLKVRRLRTNHSIPSQMPIFREMAFTLGSLTLLADASPRLIGYQVACPGQSTTWWGMVSHQGSGLKVEELP